MTDLPTIPDKPSPWSQGYAAGLSGQDVKSPYDSPAQWGEWMQGYAAGGNDRRELLIAEARKVA